MVCLEISCLAVRPPLWEVCGVIGWGGEAKLQSSFRVALISSLIIVFNDLGVFFL
jgi:hypothetical protein